MVTMPIFTLNQAAKACSKSKSAILKAIKTGRLSAIKDDLGQWCIDASELYRCYGRPEWGGKVAAAKLSCGISSWWLIMN